MNKPDSKRVKALLLAAPIGQYIGEQGSEILAECTSSEYEVADNDFLFHQGEEDHCFYFITSGHIALVKERKNKDKKPRTLHILDKGDLVGELSFIDDTAHTASAMALGNAQVICFKEDDIRPLIMSQPQFMFDFMRAIIKRVHSTVSAIGKQQMALSDYISSGGKGRL
ncbi:MAG: cyclic nucleotide-binding domain-containing protein [Methylophaga sp.]|nr:cyclic nucleotide-binding domain-containing protein [Methylophaga sp.]